MNACLQLIDLTSRPLSGLLSGDEDLPGRRQRALT